MTLPLAALYEATDGDESVLVRRFADAMAPSERTQAVELGRRLLRAARACSSDRPYLDAFLQEFGLSSEEGIALMCLAEALLRIPDDAHADRLIAEKLAGTNWASHAGASDSLFVNASTRALMLTRRVIDLPEPLRANSSGWLRRLAHRLSEPIVRRALRKAMQIMGSEFVVGRTIDEALQRSAREESLAVCSFDMLGEGARTGEDAQRYLEAYEGAIRGIGAANRAQYGAQADPYVGSSISIKLSALDPRYSLSQRGRVRSILTERMLSLARLAAMENVALTIDAEEADRLEISLEVFEALGRDAQTDGWSGLGLAVQAYGRRAPAVIDWVRDLAQDAKRCIGVRLVKGAYWDSEIKRAQERGLAGYPVYTRKVCTDVAYLACARRLLSAGALLYPQFATHNAHTLSAVLAMRSETDRFEFQRLHGMGQQIYAEARRCVARLPLVRVYAPVGAHKDLLAYLVRRLLENGANSSFVNRFMDARVSPEAIITDPIALLDTLGTVPHPQIPLPVDLYGSVRRNSVGADFGENRTIKALEAAASPQKTSPPGHALGIRTPSRKIFNPACKDECVGEVELVDAAGVERAFTTAACAQSQWGNTPAAQRAACLERAALALESERDRFVMLLVREAGKTIPDAISEIRETVDYCRYYASEGRRLFDEAVPLRGPTGESNRLSLVPRGVIACISPWNFPLAIFAGQVTAALAAGNTVVAKSAENTPLVAVAITALLHDAGVPRSALHCISISGRAFGQAAAMHESLAGIVFTGSTFTGQWLNRALAARPGAILPLIAETGGLNAMIVDSTALAEQVVDNVISSAFSSAGQRCSALRLLCLQEDIADRTLNMLVGAMQALVIGDPSQIETDVGPVISADAARDLMDHVDQMMLANRVLARCELAAHHAQGHFVAPHLIELDDVSQLTKEHFGPLLHIVRYRADKFDELLLGIRKSGYGLTLGVHTRLESTWRRIFAATSAGNVYINRNMIGAVVGVQPFGGCGLSGTGPKAGGPHYLSRLAQERTLTINTTATGGNADLFRLD